MSFLSQAVSDVVSLPKYSVVNVPRVKGKGGGVGMYICNSIKYTKINLSYASSTFEYTVVSAECNASRVLCVIVYRPPLSLLQEFISDFDLFLDTLGNLYKDTDVFISGDFNIDLLLNACNEFSDLLSSVNLYPTIYYPTRICSTTSTLIDNIFTNSNLFWKS